MSQMFKLILFIRKLKSDTISRILTDELAFFSFAYDYWQRFYISQCFVQLVEYMIPP